MNREEIITKTTGIFRVVLKNDELNLHETLTANDVDNWDSLSHMLLISEIESAFGIQFKLKELNKMKNVGDLWTIIEAKLG